MGFGSAEYLHVLTEAKKLAFEDRAKYYSDMDFNKLPIEGLISEEYAAERRKLINLNRAARRYDAGKLEQGNTIYMTVADKDGNMISLIQSNYRGMGSGMVPPKLGFMLQDRGELFSLEEGASYWSTKLTWRAFFCAMTTLATLFAIRNVDSLWGQADVDKLFSFGEFNSLSYVC